MKVVSRAAAVLALVAGGATTASAAYSPDISQLLGNDALDTVVAPAPLTEDDVDDETAPGAGGDDGQDAGASPELTGQEDPQVRSAAELDTPSPAGTTVEPTELPSDDPDEVPTTEDPSSQPSEDPSPEPSPDPTPVPTDEPSEEPVDSFETGDTYPVDPGQNLEPGFPEEQPDPGAEPPLIPAEDPNVSLPNQAPVISQIPPITAHSRTEVTRNALYNGIIVNDDRDSNVPVTISSWGGWLEATECPSGYPCHYTLVYEAVDSSGLISHASRTIIITGSGTTVENDQVPSGAPLLSFIKALHLPEKAEPVTPDTGGVLDERLAHTGSSHQVGGMLASLLFCLGASLIYVTRRNEQS